MDSRRQIAIYYHFFQNYVYMMGYGILCHLYQSTQILIIILKGFIYIKVLFSFFQCNIHSLYKCLINLQ